MERGPNRSWDMHPLTIFLLAACLSSVWLMEWKALDEFVNLPDSHYEYTFLEKEEISIYPFISTFHTINMTSQKWLDESEVDKPVWSHELTIIVPQIWDKVDSCLLLIIPGQDDTSASSHFSFKLHQVTLPILSHSVVALLKPVPDQPLTFYKHPLGLENITGYDIMAYTWWRFLNDSDAPPHWLLQFPMVKATVRAMDTVTDYVMKAYHKNITQFTLTGVSTAGWATWLTAAVDSRVVAIIPIGMDLLNFTEMRITFYSNIPMEHCRLMNFHHQYRAYCGWSYMLRPFYEMNVTQELDNARFSDLALHVDPLAYNERYTNTPKYIIIASGDEFFQLDNSHYYFPLLEGEKRLQIIPNVDYRFQGNAILLRPILAYFSYIINSERQPLVSWQRTTTNTTGIIYFDSSPTPNQIFCYHADSVDGTRRDFRMRIAAGNSFRNNPVKWIKSGVKHVERTPYKKEMEILAEGWRAFFIQDCN